MKRLSVIIPGYRNRLDWWERCVKSVLAATTGDDEIICVDDGSPNQGELKRMTIEGVWSDARIKWIWRENNGGLAVARNSGLDIAKGRYVSFVDSDDEVKNDVYNRTIAQMEASDSEIGVFGVNVIWVDERLQKHDSLERKSLGKLSPEDVQWLSRKCLFNYACNKVYKVNSCRFDPEGMPCEDLIYNLNFVISGAKWCTVDCEGYVYYRMNGTLLANYKPTNRNGMVNAAEIWKKYCDAVPAAAQIFGKNAELSEAALMNSDWLNAWKPGTPYTLTERWRMRPGWRFIKMAIFTIVRRHFYFMFIRRWNIKRNYPQVEEI